VEDGIVRFKMYWYIVEVLVKRRTITITRDVSLKHSLKRSAV